MAGLFVPIFLGFGARGLLTAGGVLMALHTLGGTLLAYIWLTAEPGSPSAIMPAQTFGTDPLALDYAQVIGSESFGERLARRTSGFFSALETQVPGIPSTLGTMLVGAGLWRSGLLKGEWERARSFKLAWQMALIALPALALLILLDIRANFDGAMVGSVSLFWSLPFDLLLAVGYAALVMGLFAGRGSAVRARLAAVGRLSLTNYLLTSLTFAVLFYSWGLGLYGQFSRSGALAIALIPIGLMLLWSPLWLAHFRQGPFEWMWRSLASGRMQALRR